MSDCIFCKIAGGEIPSAKIYEDADFMAFLDLAPATKGHALLVPKTHCENLFDLPESVGNKLLPLASKIASHMKEKLQADGFQLVQNNGTAAGQTVFHFHLHLIPRYENDEIAITWKPGKASADTLEKLGELLCLKT